MNQDVSTKPLMWLLTTSRTMMSLREVEKLADFLLGAVLEATKLDRAILFLRSADNHGKIEQHSGHTAQGNSVSDLDIKALNLASRVLKEAVPVVALDVANVDANARRALQEARAKALVCLPLVSQNENVGVLYADNRSSELSEPFEFSQELLAIFADHAATALDNARLFERATNDPLTGLPNTSYFIAQLAKVMREATEQSRAGILLLDLDSFKRVNLAAGAEMGDRALVDIANTLQEILRADGLVARYGSDKFAILLPAEEDTPIGLRLRDVAERARAAIATKNYHGVQLSASIGGVYFPGPVAEAAPDLVALADDILAKARARGAGQVEIAP